MSSERETGEAGLWLDQFDRGDRVYAERLLSAIRNVTSDEIREEITRLLEVRVRKEPGPVALFVEAERGHRKGRPHRLFKEPRRKHRRAFGHGPPAIDRRKTLNPEVGSEGLVAQIVTDIYKKNKSHVEIHPGPEQIRGRRIRRFILVSDFIGSGNRASRYLESAWRVRSVRSWWSARRSKGMSFEVVAFSATDDGRQKVEGHPSQPTVYVVEGCPTLAQTFDRHEDRVRMTDLCIRYGSLGKHVEPLGYGKCAALITFAHGMPNNAPAMFHKRGRLGVKSWVPLYPERVTTGRRSDVLALEKQKLAISLDLLRAVKQKVLTSPSFLSAPSELRDAVRVLLTIDHAPRTQVAISARTGLSINRVRAALQRVQSYGWADADLLITSKGHREIGRLGAHVRKAIQFTEGNLYIPQALRVPTPSR